MFKIKRIMAFAMAMILCTSFCLVNSGAEWYEYTDAPVDINPGVSRAYAAIDISEWPEDTGSTDLYAETGAHLSSYDGDAFVSYYVYVDLGVTLEDYSHYSDSADYWSEDEDFIWATVYGDDLLLGEPYYALIDFSSYHYVEVTEYTRFDSKSKLWYDPVTWQDGDSVGFGISY